MALTIDELQIQIQHDSQNAIRGIDALSASLAKLKSSVKGGSSLSTTANQLRSLSQTISSMSMPGKTVENYVAALKPLQSMGKNNLSSTINSLKKLPEVMKLLDSVDMGKFANQIQLVASAMRPLADEAAKVYVGLKWLPAQINKIINSNGKLGSSAKSASGKFNLLSTSIRGIGARDLLRSVINIGRRISNVISGWIKESNDYIENLNIFTVAMGDYAEAAQEYAEKVSNLLGIDPSDWMRNQAIFQTLVTGFGIASDKASLMSKNLTQLGYDLSSFFNITVEDAMQKLQSGIAGELEPLRRLGYDLSQAKLQSIALSLGIDKSVASMTQAEKSQLRYYAILTQVTTAQGDLARTLNLGQPSEMAA